MAGSPDGQPRIALMPTHTPEFIWCCRLRFRSPPHEALMRLLKMPPLQAAWHLEQDYRSLITESSEATSGRNIRRSYGDCTRKTLQYCPASVEDHCSGWLSSAQMTALRDLVDAHRCFGADLESLLPLQIRDELRLA